jgi:hypothetical protein
LKSFQGVRVTAFPGTECALLSNSAHMKEEVDVNGVVRAASLTASQKVKEAQPVSMTKYYDIAGYYRGYVWNFPFTPIGSIFTIIRIKINKVLDEEKWLTIISILGREYVRE